MDKPKSTHSIRALLRIIDTEEAPLPKLLHEALGKCRADLIRILLPRVHPNPQPELFLQMADQILQYKVLHYDPAELSAVWRLFLARQDGALDLGYERIVRVATRTPNLQLKDRLYRYDIQISRLIRDNVRAIWGQGYRAVSVGIFQAYIKIYCRDRTYMPEFVGLVADLLLLAGTNIEHFPLVDPSTILYPVCMHTCTLLTDTLSQKLYDFHLQCLQLLCRVLDLYGSKIAADGGCRDLARHILAAANSCLYDRALRDKARELCSLVQTALIGPQQQKQQEKM